MSAHLSVVIVSWNVCALLRQCLASVLQAVQTPHQTVAGEEPAPLNAEIIVVDNASHDGSADMVRTEFPQVLLIPNSDNRGFTGANNQGIAAASGRFLLLLNPDTKVLGDALAVLLHFMEIHPDVGLVGPQLLYPDGRIQSSRRRFPTLATLFLESTWSEALAPSSWLQRYYVLDQPDDVTLDVDWVIGAAILARREAIDRVGGFDESFFMYSEELDWCRRVKGAGWRVVYHPAGRIVHCEGQSSEQAVPARHINFQRSKVRYTRKYHGRPAAALLRFYLLAQYAGQLVLELGKGLLGHKRALRWERVRAYRQVLRSGLKSRYP